MRISDQQGDSYQYDDGYGTCKAPDEFVVDGDPTEIWVSITFRVQAHGEACDEDTDHQIRQELFYHSTDRDRQYAAAGQHPDDSGSEIRNNIDHVPN